MHVEIDHRHALGAMGGAGMQRGDGDVVEQAEAHGARGSAWCPGGRTAQKALLAAPAITWSTAWTAAPVARKCRVETFRAHGGVGIEPDEALPRACGADRLHVARGMQALDHGDVGKRRLLALQRGEGWG